MWNANIQLMLQSLDLLVVLKLTVLSSPRPSFEALARELAISPSSALRSLKRATDAGLVTADRKPNRHALLEFVLHGVRYVYYVKPGGLTRGIPTAHAAPPLSSLISSSSEVPVWPDPQGTVRGYTVEPLHQTVPEAVRHDPQLYELLALVDALRLGHIRERNLAAEELRRRIKP